MSLHRTPRPSQIASIAQAQSDPKVNHPALSTDLENINTRRGANRSHYDKSTGEELRELKDDIKEMLNTWKVDQEAYLNRVLSEQNVHMAKLTSDIAELKTQNITIQKSNIEIEKSMAYMNQRYEDMKLQIDLLQKEKKEYLFTITELEKKVTDIQQCSRGSAIEIRNVPFIERESVTDLVRMVESLGNVLSTPIKDIRDVYRIPGKPGTTKPVVVEFTSVQEKDKVLLASKTFNKIRSMQDRLNTTHIGYQDKPQPIYVAEYLPSSIKKLFYHAREFAKRNNFEFCWSVNGKIFLRKEHGSKHILVSSEQHLLELQKQQ